MRPIDGDELMERLQSRFYAHDLKCDFDRCARSVILSCMEAVQRSPTICEPPNDPLTLEELRGMDGDKIYVHYIDGFYTDEDGAYFGKFEQLVRECNGRLTACELPLSYYGKTWLAYRRKPEEGTIP